MRYKMAIFQQICNSISGYYISQTGETNQLYHIESNGEPEGRMVNEI